MAATTLADRALLRLSGEDVRGFGLAVEQQILALGPDDEVEQALALWGQQPGPDRQRAVDIARHQALEKAAHVFARQPDDGPVGEGGGGHGSQLGSGR